MKIILDGYMMQTKQDAHTYIQNTLFFPDYYGKNLDALFDLLTENRKQITIRIEHCNAIITSLGAYGTALLETFAEAAEQTPALTVEMDTEDDIK